MAAHAPAAYVVPADLHGKSGGDDDDDDRDGDATLTPAVSDAKELQPRRGSIGLGSRPAQCTLSWSNVSYTVTKGSVGAAHKQKHILTNVTGRCGAGELTAVIGPSGCGKTTLLDILAGRVSTGKMDGAIQVNGTKRDAQTFRAVARYVAQEDSLLGCFTVRETLRMAAQLTLPSSETTSSAAVEAKLDGVLHAMGLTVCEHTYIGDVFRKGISGGQKRRLSIAIELLSNPSILLLDEPTSGLDSSATCNLMKLLTRLCEQGRTVLCTIHQPPSLVYDTFTNVAILAKGETVYFGPRVAMIPHFTAAGHACPPYSNPSEFYIGLVNADFEGHGDIPALLAAYAASDITRDVATRIADDRAAPAMAPLSVKADVASAWRQFGVLLRRNLVKNVRNPGIFAVRLVMYVALAVCVGTMYLQTNTRLSDNDIVVLLFGIHAFFVFNSVAAVPFFIQERAVFLRERDNSGLRVGSFVVANFVAGLPGIFTLALTSSVIVVSLAGLKAFGLYLLNMFLSLVAAESLMHVLGAVANDGIIGIALGASIFAMFMVTEGFMVPRDAIPKYWVWLHYIGFNSYAFQAFVHNEFLADAAATAAVPLAVARLGMGDVSVGANMAAIAAFAVGFELVFAAILYKVHTGRR